MFFFSGINYLQFFLQTLIIFATHISLLTYSKQHHSSLYELVSLYFTALSTVLDTFANATNGCSLAPLQVYQANTTYCILHLWHTTNSVSFITVKRVVKLIYLSSWAIFYGYSLLQIFLFAMLFSINFFSLSPLIYCFFSASKYECPTILSHFWHTTEILFESS